MTETTSKSKKFCIFCGKKPETKTNEHVIPKWLIEMTGDLNRTISFGLNWNQSVSQKEPIEMNFSFNSFQFPACKKCNEDFGIFEAKAKFIVRKVLSDDYLSIKELDFLLDWLDKVRIGLWLGYLYLEKGFDHVNPKFHIQNRIGVKDRALAIYKFDDNEKGIQFGGVNLPCFSFNPSCFSLVINNYLFYNISHDYIYSKNFGFPFPTNVRIDKQSGNYFIEMMEGTKKVKNRPFRVPFFKGGTEIYQPMIQREIGGQISENYLNDYVAGNLLKNSTTHGSIFIMEDNKLEKLNEEEELSLTPIEEFDRTEFMNKYSQHLINMQVHILNFSPLLNNEIDRKLMKIITTGQKKISKIKGLR